MEKQVLLKNYGKIEIISRGWGGNHDGWFAFNIVNSGNGNYKYSRQDFYITKP